MIIRFSYLFFPEELKISQYFLCIQWKSMGSNVVLASLIFGCMHRVEKIFQSKSNLIQIMGNILKCHNLLTLVNLLTNTN